MVPVEDEDENYIHPTEDSQSHLKKARVCSLGPETSTS